MTKTFPSVIAMTYQKKMQMGLILILHKEQFLKHYLLLQTSTGCSHYTTWAPSQSCLLSEQVWQRKLLGILLVLLPVHQLTTCKSLFLHLSYFNCKNWNPHPYGTQTATQTRTPNCTPHSTSLHKEHSFLSAKNQDQVYCYIHFSCKVSLRHTNLTFKYVVASFRVDFLNRTILLPS